MLHFFTGSILTEKNSRLLKIHVNVKIYINGPTICVPTHITPGKHYGPSKLKNVARKKMLSYKSFKNAPTQTKKSAKILVLQ